MRDKELKLEDVDGCTDDLTLEIYKDRSTYQWRSTKIGARTRQVLLSFLVGAPEDVYYYKTAPGAGG